MLGLRPVRHQRELVHQVVRRAQLLEQERVESHQCGLGRAQDAGLDRTTCRRHHPVAVDLDHVVPDAEAFVVDDVSLDATGSGVEPGHVNSVEGNIPDRHAVQQAAGDVTQRHRGTEVVLGGEGDDEMTLLEIQLRPPVGVGVVATPDPVPDSAPNRTGDAAFVVSLSERFGAREEASYDAQGEQSIHASRVTAMAGVGGRRPLRCGGRSVRPPVHVIWTVSCGVTRAAAPGASHGMSTNVHSPWVSDRGRCGFVDIPW